MQNVNRWMHLPERAYRYCSCLLFCIKYIQITKEKCKIPRLGHMSMHGQVTDVQMFSQVLNDEVGLTNLFTSALFLAIFCA